jgi:hypothetical protein
LVQAVYPNSYTRVVGRTKGGEERGFTLIHSGTQRAFYERGAASGAIRHLLTRGKVLGEYR